MKTQHSYLSTNYAIYPYSGDIKITDSVVITATLPVLQHYTEFLWFDNFSQKMAAYFI